MSKSIRGIGELTRVIGGKIQFFSKSNDIVFLQANGVLFKMPTQDGTDGQTLVTNGSGILSFTTVGGVTQQSITTVSDVINTDTTLVSITTSDNTNPYGTNVYLPSSSDVSSYHKVCIVDEAGVAGLPNQHITINSGDGTGDTIIGEYTFHIYGNYNSVTLYTNNVGGWFIIQ